MNKILLQYCLLVITIIYVIPQKSGISSDLSQKIHIKELGIDYDHVYCHAGEHVVNRHIPRPDYSKILAKGGGTLGDFEVNYTGFTQEARDAFQFAVDIWDMLLDSEAKIVVNANFTELDSGILGSASPTAFYSNFSNKVDKDIEYAAPLADKIAGYSLNGNAADLSCNFSSSFNWFYNFNNPAEIASNEHDFVSVVLHEIGHGLGFLSRYTFASSERIGFMRGEAPVITDIFSLLLELGNGTNLLLNLEEASQDLGIALTGGDIFLNTHSFSKEPLPEIFAPNPWNGGSSLSHLGEIFNATDPLMTWSIGSSEVIHDPEIALDMLNDMGWRSSFIAHRSENVELVNQPLPITADIFTDMGVGFDSASVLLIYSQDSFRVTSDTLVMTSIDDNSEFKVELPAENISGRYQYYISLDDSVNKGYSSPLLAPMRYHDVAMGIDNTAPQIVHTPLEFFFLSDGQPEISALVTDGFMGVDTVIVEFRINGGNLIETGLSNIKFDQYDQMLDIESLRPGPGDIIEYRLKATDKAMASNVSYAPQTGFYNLEIKGVPDEVSYYENNFEETSADFSFAGFSIIEDSGFDGKGLHSDHPYQNAGTGNELNFIAQLRVPIKIIEDGLVEFDEVVLVEPGESGTNFGDDEFWDYVIVEVSKNNGATWIPLTDGYDSGDQTDWNTRYTNGISGQNSSSTADKSLLKRRSIALHQPALGINIDDVVVLRWRLFSDPFATGWGWIIDDLIIQGNQNTTPVVEFDASDSAIAIFPNPVKEDYLKFAVTGDISIRRMLISDSSGRLMFLLDEDAFQNDQKQVDISALPPGVYFALFQTDNVSITKRFLKL